MNALDDLSNFAGSVGTRIYRKHWRRFDSSAAARSRRHTRYQIVDGSQNRLIEILTCLTGKISKPETGNLASGQMNQ